MRKLVIDGHSHVTIPIENHIRLMDEAGIDKTVLFRTGVHPELKGSNDEIKEEMQQLQKYLTGDPAIADSYGEAAHEELFKAVNKYPNRFICFGNISLNKDLDTMTKNIQTQISKHHILGIGELALPSGQIHKLENVFKASSQTACLPLWIHCFNPMTLEDILHIEQLAKKYPSVPVIIGHAGGSNWLETIDIVKRNPNIYMDTSAAFSSLVLKLIIKELPDKTFYGVDYPYGDMWVMRKMIERACPDENIRENILGGNIMKLLKIE